MALTSAGIIAYRRANGEIEVLLGHPGGPFNSRRDEGVWSIPKGLIEGHEPAEQTARREFAEEIGFEPPETLVDLGIVRQSGVKWVHAWAAEMDIDAAEAHSNTFEMEWPPHSGHTTEFPEIDRAEWFDLARARRKIIKGQRQLLDRLVWMLGDDADYTS